MSEQASEQQDEEITIIGEETDSLETKDEDEEVEIVLAGQEPQSKPDNKEFILNRVMRKKEKLQGENAALKEQLEKLAQQAPSAEPEPDELNFDTREEYLQARANWTQTITSQAVNQQLNQQQNGHRIAAQEQEQDAALEKYAENAGKLKVSDFNDTQDKAFDVLGEDFARLIALQLPEEAPKLMYWFGKNPKDAAQYRDEYQLNPGKTTFSLGKLAGNLTVKPKRSNAASPETKIESGGVGGINEDWKAQYEKIMDTATPENTAKTFREMRALKAKAKAAGFDVSTLK